MVDLRLTPEQEGTVRAYRAFVDEVVLDAEDRGLTPDGPDAAVLKGLRKEARDRDLWAPHLPEAWGGRGLDVVTLAHVHQELGSSPLGPLAVNAMAPDEGNMHALLAFGTDDQKERYLRPLAEGRVRSCFAMTEPDAGADPYRTSATAQRDGDAWVLNGRKVHITGATGAAFALVVAVNDPEVHPKEGTSIFLVDTDTEGWEVVADMGLMGTQLPGGHGDVRLTDVRVPADRVLGPLGRGYAVAQDRLGTGRLTHAMRWLGAAQRALDLATGRALEREVFGKRLAEHQAIQWMLADSLSDLKLARLAVLDAAWRIDQGLEHRTEVSLVKNLCARAFHRIVDRAIQVHGALGYTTQLPLEAMYRDARGARIYDGPDEVHQWVMAQSVLRAYKEHGSTRGVTGGLP